LDIGLLDDADAIPAEAVLARFGPLLEPLKPGRLLISVPDGAAEIAPIVRALDEAGIGVANLDLLEPTLDDVFVEKTGRHLEGAEGAQDA
ncbi:MAG: hypothetical protein NTV40_03220, partial [Solirubrobacterales bacterium]|nr:hypothetical protein [Solirubrobacterales bacterium]